MTLTWRPGGESVLAGALPDQAALLRPAGQTARSGAVYALRQSSSSYLAVAGLPTAPTQGLGRESGPSGNDFVDKDGDGISDGSDPCPNDAGAKPNQQGYCPSDETGNRLYNGRMVVYQQHGTGIIQVYSADGKLLGGYGPGEPAQPLINALQGAGYTAREIVDAVTSAANAGVIPGDLTLTVISPGDTSLVSGEQQQFTAIGPSIGPSPGDTNMSVADDRQLAIYSSPGDTNTNLEPNGLLEAIGPLPGDVNMSTGVTPTVIFVYIVKSGDNLVKIASRLGVSVDTLLDANPNITNDIHPGDMVFIPYHNVARR